MNWEIYLTKEQKANGPNYIQCTSLT